MCFEDVPIKHQRGILLIWRSIDFWLTRWTDCFIRQWTEGREAFNAKTRRGKDRKGL